MFSLFLNKDIWVRYSKIAFLVLFAFVFILGVVYIYFMNMSVLKTAERNANLTKIDKLKREHQKLETIYINELDKLDISYAERMGFVKAEPDKYVYKQKAVATIGY